MVTLCVSIVAGPFPESILISLNWVIPGLNCFLSFTPLPNNIRADMFLYRTHREIYYLNNIDCVTAEIPEGWRGQLMVSDEAILFTKPSINAEFRYLRNDSSYWSAQVREER